MLVTHSKAASPPAPGAYGHGRMVSLGGGGCVWVCVCVVGGLGPLPGGDGCWRAGRRRAGTQLVKALALV